MTVKYYIRPRNDENPKKWTGPFDAAQLKDLAVRRLFSKDLHEYSEDRLNWISARLIWNTLFPKTAAAFIAPTPQPAATDAPAFSEQRPVEEASAVAASAPGEDVPEWYLASNGRQEGPLSLRQLRTLAAAGKIQDTDLVWNPSFGEEWVEVRTVPAIASSGGAETLPQIDTAADAGRSGKIPPFAVASFVLGLVGTSVCCGIGSLLAIVFGHVALIKYQQPETPRAGKWMAVTGLVLGYLELVLIAIVAMACLAFMPR